MTRTPLLVTTPARYRALEELVRNGGVARESNRTDAGTIYWQTCSWLTRMGLAKRAGTKVTITDAGRAAWEAVKND